jgi:hypothetical protein
MYFDTPIFGKGLIKTHEELAIEEQQRIMAEIQALRAQIAAKAQPPVKAIRVTEAADGLKKGARPVRPQVGRTYELLTKVLADWGRVPQQQRDLADIVARSFEVGEPFSEAELFAALTAHAAEYPQLAKSTMHVTYLWAYYRSFDKKDGKHASFIRRNFIRQSN